MHKVDNVTGRLVEVKVAPPLTLEEIEGFVDELRATINRIPGRYVGLVDLRQADVFPVEVAQALIELLSRMADRVERTAFLIGESAVFALQIERVIRKSVNPHRKAYRNAAELESWLGEVLTDRERERLGEFLLEVGVPG
jgi:hypothetical protein